MSKEVIGKGIDGIVYAGSAKLAEGKETEITYFGIVQVYLMAHKLTYGTAVDGRDVLAYSGITLDTEGEEMCKALAYIKYMRLAKRVASEMRSHLEGFGFDADKNNRVDHHNIVEHVDGNVVYTRWPWDAYYKAYKSARHSESSMAAEHTSWVYLEDFKANHMEAYTLGTELLSRKVAASETISDIMSSSIKPSFDEFDAYIKEHKDELVAEYSKKRPKGYGRYNG